MDFQRRWLWMVAILGALVAILIALLRAIVPSPLPPKSGFELVPVDCFNSSLKADGVDIIFVHGLGSNPDTTWQKLAKDNPDNRANTPSPEKKYVNWVTDFLCDDLPPDIRPHVRIFFYNYDSYWKRDAIEERRSRLGHELFEEITSLEFKTPGRSIVFVGHSYGGLVIKEALVNAQFLGPRRPVNIFLQIKAIMFLGTPHRGSASASLGVKAAKLFRALGMKASPSIVEAVTYDSLELQGLHHQFDAVSDHVRIVNVYEKRKMQVFWGLWSELVVKEQSATLGGPNAERIGLHTDHSGLNKFAERDSNYKKIRNKLIQLTEAISADARVGTSVYSLPQKTEKLYTERSSLSKRLEEKLNKPLHGSNQIAHAVAIYGLGGAGKTQLALRFAERHKLRYDTILWIDARSEATIRSSFQRCARDLKLITGLYSAMPNLVALKDDPAVRVVLSWLQNRNQLHDEWLVILNDADDLSSGVRDIIPSGTRGSIILTSRDIECVEVLPLGSQRLQVGIMEPSEAVSLLLQHLNLGIANVSEDIRGLSLTICENLEHLALAVHLAGAHIRSSCVEDVDLESDNYSKIYSDPKSCLESYLQNYKNHKNRLLQDRTITRLSSYNQSVWTVWDTSLDAVEKISSFPSRRLLTLLAHMDPTNIQDEIFHLVAIGQAKAPRNLTHKLPQWLLELVSVNEDGQWDRFAYRETLKPLRIFGLVHTSNADYPGVAMHALVQWRAKLDNTRQPHQPWNLYYSAFMAIASTQALSEPNNTQFWQHMVPHLPLSKDLLSIESDARVMIWEKLGALFGQVKQLEEAETLLLKVMETRKEALGAEHPDTLISMDNLALTYSNQGRWKEAKELLVQTVEVWRRMFGVEHPDTLISMEGLATTYKDQGGWKKAEGLQVQVMETRKKMVGAEHRDTLISMDNLASIYAIQGQWKKAEELLVQTVEVWKRMLGAENPDTMVSMSGLASTYVCQGRWKEAEDLQVQVMERSKKVLGTEHPNTLTSMSDLALTYTNQGRWKKAEELGVQVVERRKKVLGSEHPDTLTSISNLASTYASQGRLKEAEGLLVQVVDISRRMLGMEHPSTITSMSDLALTYTNQGRLKEAEELGVQVVKRRKKVLGSKHPDTLTCISNLALTYIEQGRLKEAEGLLVQVVDISRRMLGMEHPSTITRMNNLALTYMKQGRLKEAEELGVQVVKRRKKVLGSEHPDTLTSISNLASTYASQGRLKEAEGLLVQVVDISRRMLGMEHPSTITRMNNLVVTYMKQGRLKEAEELGVQVLDTCARVFGEEHPDTLTSMSNLASTYAGQGRWKKAEEIGVQVVERRKEVLGAEHPDTLISMDNLALTYSDQGRWKEAEGLLVQVVEASRRVPGVEHPDTITSMGNLAAVYMKQGRWEQAEGLLVQVVEACKSVFGVEHSDTLNSVAILAFTRKQLGK